MDTHILAYLAGVIDSDGFIGIKRSDYAMRVRGDAGQPVYSERVGCKQVQPQAVDLLHETFGGYRRLESPTALKGRPLYSWSVHSAAAGRALTALRPYLRIKAAQADNALELRRLMGQGRRWPVPAILEGEPLITATEFAARLGIKQDTILQACFKGSVPSIRIGRSRMMPESFLPVYAARYRPTGSPPRDAVTSTAMEACFQRAKALNHVGI